MKRDLDYTFNRTRLTPISTATVVVVASAGLLLWPLVGCQESDGAMTNGSATKVNSQLVSRAGTTTAGDPAEVPPSNSEVFAHLNVLQDDGDVRVGMSKDQLVDVLAQQPQTELLEFTNHSAALSVLIAGCSAVAPAAEPANSTHSVMVFLLHDDYLALALESRIDRADVLWAIDENGEEAYGGKRSYPPRELREWAAENDYFDSDDLSLYLHVEDAVARNIWHESQFNASFRQPKDQGDYFWFMLARRQPAEPSTPISAVYGVIDPHGLPDDIRDTADEMGTFSQWLTHEVSNASREIFSARMWPEY